MLLLANLANKKDAKNIFENVFKSWNIGTHLRVFGESFPMNTSMTGFRQFSKMFASLCFERASSLSIGRVNWSA